MINDVYKHYKGRIYILKDVGIHTETNEEMAIYQDLNGQTYVRPLEMFMDIIEVDGSKIDRFKNIGHFRI